MEPSGDSPKPETIHAEYTRRLEARRAERDRHARLEFAIGNRRLVIFGVGAAVAWLALGQGMFSAWWIVAPLLVFLWLVVRHDRVIRQKERLVRAVTFYENGLRRLEDRWAGRGVSGNRFSDPHHPYSDDLDIFGNGSLFELLCTARTRVGEECLAAWLRAPAAPETVRARQEAVADLRPRLDLREDLALLGEEARSAMHPEAFAEWGAEPPQFPSPNARIGAITLIAATLIALMGWAFGLGPLPFALLFSVEQGYAALLGRRVRHILKTVDRPAKDLALLASLLARIESERFDTPRLQHLKADLDMEGKPPSARIAHLQSLLEHLSARYSIFFAPIAALLLWTPLFAFAIEQWRIQNGPRLERWLQVIGEFEALGSLANYAFERPANPFPEILDTDGVFEAEGLAHPLLPAEKVIANDLRIDATARLYIVSGSNMSGKSTLLRTVGTNVVLALAGAPVCATRLRLAPVHLGASIRTQDSLQAGVSRFYAEITRLRQIVEIAETSPPLLFLLDEILHGTNSHDRRVGAEAVVRALLKRGASGLMTTHDLALARIAEDTTLAATNVHFQDHIEDGKMLFDYRLHPGIVTKSNALELMRAVGLEV